MLALAFAFGLLVPATAGFWVGCDTIVSPIDNRSTGELCSLLSI
jgi:hypothetical protein